MATRTLHLTVITPERRVLDAEADAVVLPAHDGELGVLYQRAPLMCELGVGELRYRSGGRTEHLFIDGGFAQVFQNAVTVLTDRGALRSEIDSAMLSAAESAARGGSADTPGPARDLARRRLAALRKVKSTDR